MTPSVIQHLFGGALPQGMTRRVHMAKEIPAYRRTAGERREALLEPILRYLKAHPWQTAPQIAAGIHKANNKVSGMLSRHVDVEIERRGESGSYEYRLKE